MAQTYHTTILVTDIPKSKMFYDGMFRILGWKEIYDDEQAKAYTDEQFSVWIMPAKQVEPVRGYDAPGVDHLAFHVDRQEQVDEIHHWLVSVGAGVDRQPQRYPDYGETYYSVFFFDPDGTRLEVAFA
jgi:catechol 2,3-dioxygenase-like lactoylglutathione lyase family enzyme